MYDWKIANLKAYDTAVNRGLLNDIYILNNWPKTKFKWSKKMCIKEAKKYKTRTEWVKNSSGSYTAARNNNWVEICSKHMIITVKSKNYWTLNKVKQEAKKFKTIKEWIIGNHASHGAAKRHNWFDECIKHMINPKIKWTRAACIKEAKKYKIRTEWANISGSSYNSARKNKWLDECCEHMK